MAATWMAAPVPAVPNGSTTRSALSASATVSTSVAAASIRPRMSPPGVPARIATRTRRGSGRASAIESSSGKRSGVSSRSTRSAPAGHAPVSVFVSPGARSMSIGAGCGAVGSPAAGPVRIVSWRRLGSWPRLATIARQRGDGPPEEGSGPGSLKETSAPTNPVLSIGAPTARRATPGGTATSRSVTRITAPRLAGARACATASAAVKSCVPSVGCHWGSAPRRPARVSPAWRGGRRGPVSRRCQSV